VTGNEPRPCRRWSALRPRTITSFTQADLGQRLIEVQFTTGSQTTSASFNVSAEATASPARHPPPATINATISPVDNRARSSIWRRRRTPARSTAGVSVLAVGHLTAKRSGNSPVLSWQVPQPGRHDPAPDYFALMDEFQDHQNNAPYFDDPIQRRACRRARGRPLPAARRGVLRCCRAGSSRAPVTWRCSARPLGADPGPGVGQQSHILRAAGRGWLSDISADQSLGLKQSGRGRFVTEGRFDLLKAVFPSDFPVRWPPAVSASSCRITPANNGRPTTTTRLEADGAATAPRRHRQSSGKIRVRFQVRAGAISTSRRTSIRCSSAVTLNATNLSPIWGSASQNRPCG